MIDMQVGQRLKLSEDHTLQLYLDLDRRDLRHLQSALLLYAEGARLGREAPTTVVHRDAPRSADGAATWSELGYTLDLRRMGQQRAALVMWVSEQARATATALSSARSLAVIFKDRRDQPMATFAPAPSSFGREGAMIHCEIYFKGSWRCSANGSGFLGGVRAMASRLALSNADLGALDAHAAPPPPPRAPSRAPSRPDLRRDRRPSPSRQGSSASAQGILPVTLPSVGPRGDAELTAREIPRALTEAVGRVYAMTREGSHTGTAFVITPGGCMVTCHHVVEDATDLSVSLGRSTEQRPVDVVASSAEHDLALLRFRDINGTPAWLQLADLHHQADLGTEVGLLGYPLGQLGDEVNYTRGIVNSTRTLSRTPVFQVDAGAAPGSSGGPLFQLSDGRVLGVLSSGISSQNMGMHVNLAVSVTSMLDLGWLRR
ncbi:MAG: trypsin-like peptidase domain-containing protein [Bradymonadia bacterium]